MPRFYIDADNDKWVTGGGLRDLLLRAEFKRSPSLDVEIQFFKQGLPYELAEDEMPAVGEIGIKKTGDFDGPFLVHASEWEKKGEGASTYYLLNPAFNGIELNELLGHDMTVGNDEASVSCMTEIRWFENGKVHKTQTVATTIFNDVIKGSEGTPGESADPGNYYTEDETNALLQGKVDKVEGKELSSNDFTDEAKERLAGAVGQMIDLPTPPVATVVAVTIEGTAYEDVRMRLINAGADGDYQDTAGRNAYTLDGTFDEGNFYDPYISFDPVAPAWRLDAVVYPYDSGSVGEITIHWFAPVTDGDIQNINNWPWEGADFGIDLGLPTFVVEFETDVPGMPGQRYRVPVGGGHYEHYEKQPDSSFIRLGTFDALGRNIDLSNAFKRSYHTGTQSVSTLSDFEEAVDGRAVGLWGDQIKSGVLTFASPPKGTGSPTYTDSTEYLTQGQIEEFLIRPQTFIEVDNFLTAKRWYEQMTGTGSVDDGYNAAGGLGGFALNTGATSGSIAGLAIGVNGNFSPLSYKPWKLRFRIRTGGTITNCKIRVGLSGNGNTFSQDLWAVGGMGFDYNPSLNANWRFANDPGGGSPSYTNMAVAVAANTTYDFLIRSTGTDNQCYVSINGGAETLITGARDYFVGPALAIQNTAAASRSLIPLAFGLFAHRP